MSPGDAKILALRAEGCDLRTIAAAVGSTRDAVRVRLGRLRGRGVFVPPPPARRWRPLIWTPDLTAEALRIMAETGYTAAVAKALGLSISAVRGRFRALRGEGVDVPVSRRERSEDHHALVWTEARTKALVDGYHAGLSDPVLATQLGVSSESVAQRLVALRAAGQIGQVNRRALRAKMTRADRAAAAVARAQARAIAKASVPDTPRPAPKVAAAKPPRPVVKPVVAKPVVVKPVVAKPVVSLRVVSEQKSDLLSVRFQASAGAVRLPGARALHFVRVVPGMTAAQRDAALRDHFAALPAASGFDAGLDLDLCVAVFSGLGLARFAEDHGMGLALALARFDEIVAPLRDPARGRHLPIEAPDLILPYLRAAGVSVGKGVAA